MSSGRSEIGEMFTRYDTRKLKERRESEANKVSESDRLERARIVLRSIVLPVLNEISGTIESSGRKSGVRESFCSSNCGLSFYFYPDREDSSASEFTVTRMVDSDSVIVRVLVYASNEENTYATNKEIAVSEISEKLFRELTSDFVAAVLDNN